MARSLFKLSIDMSNAAFADDPYGEVARILIGLAHTIEDSESLRCGKSLYDGNGNIVGEVKCPMVR